jgi:predicted DNA-binding protein
MSKTITVRLSEKLSAWLEEESRKSGIPKGQIVRDQLERSRVEGARKPYLDLAGSLEGAPDLSSRKGLAS